MGWNSDAEVVEAFGREVSGGELVAAVEEGEVFHVGNDLVEVDGAELFPFGDEGDGV